jgi:hypothetical protein
MGQISPRQAKSLSRLDPNDVISAGVSLAFIENFQGFAQKRWRFEGRILG